MGLLLQSPWLFVLHVALAAVVSSYVLRRRREPMEMLSWILAIFFLPGLGALLYGIIGANHIRRKAGRRRRNVAQIRGALLPGEQSPGIAGGEVLLAPDLQLIERIGRRVCEMPVSGGNRVEVFGEANATYAALEAAIQAATHHVHLEYYIWNDDDTGRHFRDLVIAAAKRGVQCRILLDSVGCLTLSAGFLRPMREAGVQVAFSLSPNPLSKRWTLHLRNHRKIAVIDGTRGFVGSQNIGDEYRGRLKRLSPWYDSHLRVEGPASLYLQQTFAEDWFLSARESLAGSAFFPPVAPAGDSLVQVLPTGPDQDVNALGQMIFAAVAVARSSIRIVTPYFVPYPALQMALIHAALRGVNVQLVLPTKSDSPLVLWAGRSYYAELLEAGVQIFEFERGMLHSKIMTVDDRFCMLGSANMDVRSFRLNFEVTALMYDARVATGQAGVIDRHCRESRAVTMREVRTRPMRHQLLEGVARLFAPLL